MNTIDVTTITNVKYFNTNNNTWVIPFTPSTLPPGSTQIPYIPIKPNTNVDLSSSIQYLFRARYVKIEEEWIDILGGGSFQQKKVIKNGLIANPGDNTVSHLQNWGFFFPEGVYLFDNGIVRQKIWIVGAGTKTVFKSFQISDLANQSSFEKTKLDLIKPIITHATTSPLKSVIIENITFEDASKLKFVGDQVVIRNCWFYHMYDSAIDITRSNHILIENNYLGFRPGAIGLDKGTYQFNALPGTTPPAGFLKRNDAISCDSMGFATEAIGGAGQGEIQIENNFCENTGDNSISVRGIEADFLSGTLPYPQPTIESSGVSNVIISDNRIINAGKAGIKLTYENGKKGNKQMPYGQINCVVSNNFIKSWGINKSEAAITCDNDTGFTVPRPLIQEIFLPSEYSDEYLSGIPLQEIYMPPLLSDDYFEYDPDSPPDPTPGAKYVHSIGLTLKNNTILGSGRGDSLGTANRENYGITARKWKNISIVQNIISGTPLYDSDKNHYESGSTIRSGIQLNSCQDFAITRNVITNAVYVFIEENVPVFGNQNNNSRGGIRLIGCQSGTISANIIKNPGARYDNIGTPDDYLSNGIVLWATRFCIVSDNVISCYNPKHLLHASNIGNAAGIQTIKYAVVEQGEFNLDPKNRSAENFIGSNKVFNLPGASNSLFNSSVVTAFDNQYMINLSDSVEV